MINYYIEKEKRGRMDINIVKKKNEIFILAYFDFVFDVVTYVVLYIGTFKKICINILTILLCYAFLNLYNFGNFLIS